MNRFELCVGLWVIAVSVTSVWARDSRVTDADNDSKKPSHFSVFDRKADHFNMRTAYLSAVATMAVSMGAGKDLLAENDFDQVVEIENENGDPTLLMAANETMILIVLTGEQFSAVNTLWKYMQMGLEDVSRWGGEDVKVHSECASAIDAVWDDLTKHLGRLGNGKEVWLAGHGIGGSLALLTGYRLAVEEVARVSGIFTFGQPKVGNAIFSQHLKEVLNLNKDGSPVYRVVHSGDIVPRLKPPYVFSRTLVTDTLSPYAAIGSLVYLYRDGGYEINPDHLENIDANIFELKDFDNHSMYVYQNSLYECLAEDDQQQLPSPLRNARGKRGVRY
ncbi:MAG TPA: lipase family protein [Candidatus Latescibacteria bacterium]|nr:lipase family protein [Candidatus Latescibacterota bacterium]